MLSISHTTLSQNKENNVNAARWAAFRAISVLFFALIVLMPSAAHAGVTGFDTVERKSVIYKTSFDEIADIPNPRLDWRNPTAEMTFTIPESAWVEKLELLISGSPNGRVDPNAPIIVQFNNAEPITLSPGPYRFDARLKLDRAHIRARNNKVTFSYNRPVGDHCPSPKSGAWDLDYNSSTIVIQARTRMRAIHMRDLKTQLNSATLSPKKVSITAFGQNRLKLKSLVAQGVGLNMSSVPQFQSKSTGADLRLAVGTRTELRGKLKDTYALRDTGPRMIISEGHPLHVTLTGDTDAEVMEIVKAFATYELPQVRRRKANLGDFLIRQPFSLKRTQVAGRVELSQISPLRFSDNWGAQPQTIRFDVENPAVSYGKAVIRMQSASSVHPDSIVDVVLNGRRLGQTKLDARRKSVSFDIPRGILKGLGNQLTITPDLTPYNSDGDCNFAKIIPGFSLGTGSYIDIKTDKKLAFNDLTRLAASGHPFAAERGSDTAVVLHATNAADQNASLRVLTQLALAAGTGLTEASYQFSETNPASKKNIFFVGSAPNSENALIRNAPRSLKTAMQGMERREMTRFQTASMTIPTTHQLLSLRELGPHRVRGGVAAVYRDTQSNRTIGMVSNMPGRSFSRSVDYLLRDSHWNELEGSVAKWDEDNVLMAQTALPAEYYKTDDPRAPKESNLWGFAEISSSLGDKISATWFSVRMAGIQASDKIQGFMIAALGPRQVEKTAETPLPRARAQAADAPRLRGQQVDKPVFISRANLDSNNAQTEVMRPPIYQPPALRGPHSMPEKVSKLPATSPALKFVTQRWQDLTHKANAFISRSTPGLQQQTSVTFWAAIFAVFLILMSLANPKSRT